MGGEDAVVGETVFDAFEAAILVDGFVAEVGAVAVGVGDNFRQGGLVEILVAECAEVVDFLLTATERVELAGEGIGTAIDCPGFNSS